MSLLAILASTTSMFKTFANLPQIIKIFKEKDAKSISWLTQIFFITNTFIWLLYGVELNNLSLMITQSAGLASCIFMIFGKALYGTN